MQSTPKLSDKELRSALIGMTLGDASIQYLKCKNASIRITQSPKQQEYLKWKANIINQITGIRTEIIELNTYLKETKKTYPQLRLYSTSSKFLNHIHASLYKGNKKKINMHLLKRLTPLALAIWYMDDGNLAFHYKKNKNGEKYISGREVMLNTQCFSYEEHLVIQQYFKECLNIEVKIHKNKGSFRIAMNGTQGKKFIEIISPWIIPEMHYKIDFRYKT